MTDEEFLSLVPTCAKCKGVIGPHPAKYLEVRFDVTAKNGDHSVTAPVALHMICARVLFPDKELKPFHVYIFPKP